MKVSVLTYACSSPVYAVSGTSYAEFAVMQLPTPGLGQYSIRQLQPANRPSTEVICTASAYRGSARFKEMEHAANTMDVALLRRDGLHQRHRVHMLWRSIRHRKGWRRYLIYGCPST